MAKEFKVRFPDGTDGWVSETDLPGVLRDYKGASVVTEGQEKAGSQELRAGLEGAARALTFGASDIALPEFYGADREMMASRQKENPASAITGEIGGTVAGLFIPGSGPAQVARVGTLAKGTAVGAKAALRAGLAEGGLYGLSRFVSEEALHPDSDLPTAAERLAGNVVAGSVTGGAFSLAGYGASKIAGKILDKTASWDISKDLKGLADKVVVNKLGLQVDDDVMAYAKARGVLNDAMTAEGVHGQVAGELAKDVSLKQQLRDAFDKDLDDEAAKALRQAFTDLREEFSKNPKNANILKKVESELDDVLRSKTPAPVGVAPDETLDPTAIRQGQPAQPPGPLAWPPRPGIKAAEPLAPMPRARGPRGEADTLVDAAAPRGKAIAADAVGPLPKRKPGNRYYDVEGNIPELEGTRNARGGASPGAVQPAIAESASGPGFENKLGIVIDWLEGRVAPGGPQVSRRTAEGALVGKLRERFMEHLGEEGAQYAKLTEDIALGQKLLEAVDAGRRAAGSDLGAAALGALGGAAGGPAGAAAGVGAAAARRYGPYVAAKALRSPWTAKAAEGLRTHLNKLLEVGPALLNRFTGPVSMMTTLGANELLDAHVKLAASESGPEYLATIGLEKEPPEAVEALSGRVSEMNTLRTVLEAQDARVDGAFVDAPASITATNHKPMSTEELSDVVKKLSGEIKLGDATSAFGYTPTIAADALAKAGQVRNWLLSKAPKDPNEGLPKSVHTPWAPSGSELRAFARYLEAAKDPYKLADEIKAGVVYPETLDTVRNLYPRVYLEIQKRMAERLAEYKGALSPQRREVLNSTLGLLSGGFSPQQALAIQQVHAKGGSGKGSGPDGRQVVNQQKNMETQAQRLEGRV